MHYIVPIIEQLEPAGGKGRIFRNPMHRELFGLNVIRVAIDDTHMTIKAVGPAPDFVPQRAEFHDELIAQPGVTFVDD